MNDRQSPSHGPDAADRDFTLFLNEANIEPGVEGMSHYKLLYQELRRTAMGRRFEWNGSNTIGVTALVNEAYLKIFTGESKQWESRAHFFSYASRVMRHILINYSRDRQAVKRGGDAHHVSVDDIDAVSDDTASRLVEIDDALETLAKSHPRHVRIVEMKIFGGFTVEEIAEAMEIGTATVKRDWKVAKARLYQLIAAHPQPT